MPLSCWSSFESVSEEICSWTCLNTRNVSFAVPFASTSSRCNITLPRNQTCETDLLQAVKSVSTPSEGEADRTKEIIADVLRGFLLLENTALTGSEQVFAFGVAGKSYAYSHIAFAFRETWDNDERLRSHHLAVSQQLQGGHLAGGAHWTGEEIDWQEIDYDYDYEDSLDP